MVVKPNFIEGIDIFSDLPIKSPNDKVLSIFTYKEVAAPDVFRFSLSPGLGGKRNALNWYS